MILGKTISADDILEQVDFFDSWEEKYAFIIDLGKNLPACADCDCIEKNEVKGCQSKAWINHSMEDGKLVFTGNSDAIIVKGLMAIILTAYNYKTPQEIIDFDMQSYFAKLDLLKHISNVRGNGIQAMVQRIKNIAQSA